MCRFAQKCIEMQFIKRWSTITFFMAKTLLRYFNDISDGRKQICLRKVTRFLQSELCCPVSSHGNSANKTVRTWNVQLQPLL